MTYSSGGAPIRSGMTTPCSGIGKNQASQVVATSGSADFRFRYRKNHLRRSGKRVRSVEKKKNSASRGSVTPRLRNRTQAPEACRVPPAGSIRAFYSSFVKFPTYKRPLPAEQWAVPEWFFLSSHAFGGTS